jgi:protocatechuate 3,4-dioxygenase beta subunit
MNDRVKFASRREVLGAAVAVGGLAAATPLQRALAATATFTPMQTMGPFYPITRPLDTDADLTVVQGRSGRAQGKIVHLMGRVLDDQGMPVRGAKIELWQCNAQGRYAHPADVNPAPLDPNFQGFGIQTTDADGQYRFKTIKPAAYPIGPMNPDAIRTPHIHFDIAGANTRLVTQMYFPGEPQNETDIIFGNLTAAEKIATTASILPPAVDMEPDSLVARWDIVLLAG